MTSRTATFGVCASEIYGLIVVAAAVVVVELVVQVTY